MKIQQTLLLCFLSKIQIYFSNLYLILICLNFQAEYVQYAVKIAVSKNNVKGEFIKKKPVEKISLINFLLNPVTRGHCLSNK